METIAERFKALSDPTRLRILRLLLHGELCVCDLMEGLDLPQSTISRHMSLLKRGGWVAGKRAGKWVHYKLASTDVAMFAMTLEILRAELPKIPEAQEDHARLLAYLETKADEACD